MEAQTVKELMTPDPCLISPESTIEQAAQKMQDTNCGALPVGTKDKLEGILTDRDIVLRAVSHDRSADDTLVRDVMTSEVFTCKEGDTLQQATDEMARHKVGRLVALDQNGQASGILSFGGILRNTSDPQRLSAMVRQMSIAGGASAGV